MLSAALHGRFGAGLQVMRQGKAAPFSGKLGPFDLLVVPAQGLSPTVAAPVGGQTLRIALPRGTTLTHGDLLRLGFEQNSVALAELARREELQVSPWILPTLRARARGAGREADWARWRLVSLYLF